ncbi:MAG: class II glutamine amidotransferase [Clostridia bacterium]|nr:class II glutamine amidotransferase [Clostridia bacterium]
MCCLFGIYNYSGQEIRNLSNLTNLLAENATVRGTDATGIAYNNNGKLTIHKEAKSAHMINFRHPDDVVCITGHTRHATQGDKKKNYNNHPFAGSCTNLRFALAHNGVLINDAELKLQYHLPKTKIVTDSFVAVQLLEKRKHLDIESVKFMAEKVSGSFAFTILDSSNALWFVRGDSPLSLVHLPKYKLYVYASTDEILYKALVDTKLFAEIKNGSFEEVAIRSGDIIRLLPDGKLLKDVFNYTDYSSWYDCRWWNNILPETQESYIENLKTVAAYQGFAPETVDELLDNGFSPEEIEEYIYCLE